MLQGSRVLDADASKLWAKDIIALARGYELAVIYCSGQDYRVPLRLTEMLKGSNSGLKVALVGPAAANASEKLLRLSENIDFIVKGEFDSQIVDYATGKAVRELPGVSYRENGSIRHNAPVEPVKDLDQLPWVAPIYTRDLDIPRYDVPTLLHPYVSIHASRGSSDESSYYFGSRSYPVPRWRVRSARDVASEILWILRNVGNIGEFFFEDEAFNYEKSHTLELCRLLKSLNIRWSCNARVTAEYETLKAMKEAGCRLMMVNYESGDPEILHSIRSAVTPEKARLFTRQAQRLGVRIHGRFTVGAPGESPSSVQRTIDFAKNLDVQTLEVSLPPALPGTPFFAYLRKNGFIVCEGQDGADSEAADWGYSAEYLAAFTPWVDRFYDEYYFRPRVMWRIVTQALLERRERRRLASELRVYWAMRKSRRGDNRMLANIPALVAKHSPTEG